MSYHNSLLDLQFHYLLVIQNELKEYKNSLDRNKKKEFYIPTKDEKRKIKEK